MSELKRLRTSAWGRKMRDFDAETLERIFDLSDGGTNAVRISQIIGSNEKAIREVLGDRDLYDPQVDEVAMRRALKFEVEVVRNLTKVEWDEFCREMNARHPWNDYLPFEPRTEPGWGDLPWQCRVAVKARILELRRRAALLAA